MQTGAYTSPLRRGETIDVSPEDAERLGLAEEECVVVSSRRGSVEVPVHVDQALRPGLVFMTFHFPDQVDTNVLTIEATDPKSGTAEFKAAAVRIDKMPDDRDRRFGSRAGPGSSIPRRDRAPVRPRPLGGAVDLKLMQAEPSADERAAVDDLLGPPAERLGRRRANARRSTTGSRAEAHDARDDRHLLLPALHALQGGGRAGSAPAA